MTCLNPFDSISNRPTRRDVLRLGIASAAFPLGSLAASRKACAIGEAGGARGTIYVFAADIQEPGVDLVRGIFAVNPETHTWTKVADQSASNVLDAVFRVSHNGRFLAIPRYPKGQTPLPDGVLIRDLRRDGAIHRSFDLGGNALWSPDDEQLLIDIARKGIGSGFSRMETWLVNVDGFQPKRLPIPVTDQVGDWSPDGSWIVTTSYRDKGIGYQLYRMRLDGTDVHRLTQTGKNVSNLYPRISPDGQRIAYYRSGLWVMNADGSGQRQFFEQRNNMSLDQFSWSPDGKRVATTFAVSKRQKNGVLASENPRLMILDIANSASDTVHRQRTAILGAPEWAVSWRP